MGERRMIGTCAECRHSRPVPLNVTVTPPIYAYHLSCRNHQACEAGNSLGGVYPDFGCIHWEPTPTQDGGER